MQETLRKSSFVFECQMSIQLNECLNYRGFLSSYKHRIITWRFPWITWSQNQQFPIDAEFTHLWWIRYDNQTNVQQTLHITFAVWCTCILIFAYLTQHIPSDIQRYSYLQKIPRNEKLFTQWNRFPSRRNKRPCFINSYF